MPKIVNTALKAKAKAKAKAWTFEAKAKAKDIKFGLEARPGLEDYITGSARSKVKYRKYRTDIAISWKNR